VTGFNIFKKQQNMSF